MALPKVGAALEPREGGRLGCVLINRSGHPEVFYVSGVLPEVYISIDGNKRYHTTLTPMSGSASVEIRSGGPEGPLLDRICPDGDKEAKA